MEPVSKQVREVIEAAVGKHLLPLLEEIKNERRDWIGAATGRVAPASREKGELAGRFLCSLLGAKGDPERAVAFAKAHWEDDEQLQKALSSSTGADGGFLVIDEVSSDLIELLRAPSVVRRMMPMTVPLDSGTLRMPKHTTGSSGGWIGENANATATQPAFGQVVLTAKKYASLVPVSNDLVRRASQQMVPVVRDDLVADIATATDLAYIRGDGASSEPKGLLFQALAANKLDANATVNLANVTTDLGIVLQTLMDNDVRMIRVGWIMEPRTWRYLITVRDGNGNYAFKPEMDSGTLFGFPFAVTSQIPRNLDASGLGNSNETELYLADFADVVLGQATQMMVDVSNVAAYHDGSNVQAAFSLDQTVVRAIFESDLAVRHGESVVVLEEVAWGA